MLAHLDVVEEREPIIDNAIITLTELGATQLEITTVNYKPSSQRLIFMLNLIKQLSEKGLRETKSINWSDLGKSDSAILSPSTGLKPITWKNLQLTVAETEATAKRIEPLVQAFLERRSIPPIQCAYRPPLR